MTSDSDVGLTLQEGCNWKFSRRRILSRPIRPKSDLIPTSLQRRVPAGLVRKNGNKYKFLSANFVKTGGFRDQISTITHAAISLKIIAFESSFPTVYIKSGPRVHRPPRFWATYRRKFAWHFAYGKYTFWQSCLLHKESHMALILYFDWLIFMPRMKLQIFASCHETKNWSPVTL